MTVAELKGLLDQLPDDMDVFMPVGEEALVSVCYSQSDVNVLEAPGEPTREIFLLMPCNCGHEEDLPIDLEPNLN